MTITETVISELRSLARVYTPVRNQLLEMAVRLESDLGTDERLKWEALGIAAVCADCGRSVLPLSSCDLCRPPFDPVPRS
jgi:hypothetical protein